MKVETAITLHNRFDVEVRDALSGELKQQAKAYNIVLDQMWTRLCAGNAYFVNIHFGTGTGALAVTRTSLFTHLGTRAATDDTLVRAFPNSSWRRRIVLNPEEFVGASLSEVGVAFGTGTTTIVTHALLEDAAGNPITILKTSVDVVTIFATIFVTFSAPADVVYINMPNGNGLVNYLIGGAAAPSGAFSLGEAVGAGSTQMTGLGSQPALGSTAAATWTADTANRRRTTGIMRFGTTVGNGHAAEYIFSNVFRARLPLANVFTGQAYVNVPVGNGDGATRDFVLPSRNIRQESIAVKLNDLATTAFIRTLEASGFNYCYSLLLPMHCNGIALSANGAILAAAHLESPFVSTYDWTGGAWARRPNPAVLPASTGRGAALSADGAILAVAHDASPFISTYDWNGSAWIRRPNPAVLPAGMGLGAALSASGAILAVAHDVSPFLSTYDWNGSAWIRRPNPASLPTGIGRGAALSAGGAILAVAHSNGPFISTYDWNGSAWIRRPNPAVWPTGIGTGAALSADGAILAVAHDASPFISTYDWNGSAWIRRPNPAVLPVGTGYGAALSANGAILAVVHWSSPFLSTYDWSGTAWIRRPNPVVLPGLGWSAAFSADGTILAAGGSSSVVYDAIARTTRISFDTAPPAGASITADYIVDGVHKTDQFVIDVGFSIQYGTPA